MDDVLAGHLPDDLARRCSPAALLAFALSIDDFVITNFTARHDQTFPLWIWGATRVGLPPQVNVMGTLIFAIGVLIAVITNIRSRPSKKAA